MQLYLLRHGTAERDSVTGRDADRRLSPDGAEDLGVVLQRVRSFGAKPTLILSSPYARAVQTAELAARALGCDRPPVISPCLTPDSTPRAVWDEVRLFPDEPAVLLVGHEPLLSATAAWMLGPGQDAVAFRPGGIVCIDFEVLEWEPRGVIRWDLVKTEKP